MSRNEAKNQQDNRSVIQVQEPEPFEAIAESKYITSNDFCKLVSELFKSAFADYEGCTFNVGNGGEPSISLIFNHGNYSDDDIVACHRTTNEVGSTVIDRTRSRDRFQRDGDRYYLTEDGINTITPLLIPRMYNNGKPDWKRITGEFVDRNNYNYYNAPQLPQYTKVDFIDIRRLSSLIFGSTTADGDKVEYDFRIIFNPTNNQYGMTPNYLLDISRVGANEVKKIYEKLGFGSLGSTIVR